MRAVIVTGGEISLQVLSRCLDEYKDAVIVSVDAAINKLVKLSVSPDVMTGDFDTLSDDELISKYEKNGVKIVRHNPVKNFSDSELAVEWAYEEGIREAIMPGALGRRFDHTLSNVLLILKYKKLGMNIVILDDYNKMYVKSESFSLERKKAWGKYIGFFALEENVLLESVSGVAYPVRDKMLDNFTNPGLFISNEIADETMNAVFTGDILVIESRD